MDFRTYWLLAALITAQLVIFPAAAQIEQPDWISDPKTGCRIWATIDSPQISFSWSGGCENGLAEGEGVFESFISHRPCERYEGGWHAGKKSGYGVDRWFFVGCVDEGWQYEGEWRDGKKNGHGVLRIGIDAGRREGEFRDDEMNGYGVFDAFHFHYEGEFRNSLPSGHGTATLPDGQRYEGEWRDGEPNGEGVFTTSDKTYHGLWSKGCFKEGDKWISVDPFLTARCP